MSETQRAAYLNLMRLALCDWISPKGSWTGPQPNSGKLEPEWLGPDRMYARREGRDWPLYAMTMTGTDRLLDLQHCVETLVADDVAGDLIECGCWRGGSSMMMRATLNSLGEGRTVVAADSFEGFRASDGNVDEALSHYDILSASLSEVQAAFAHLGLFEGSAFVKGYFADTMPLLASRPWALIRLDTDTYWATKLCLETLYSDLSPGGFVILDDYVILPQVQKAVLEFRTAHHLEEPLEVVDWNLARWRRAS